jgi:murein DD-endopeptidase MepM/ murein hydrolase activator NlpD
VVIGHLPGVYTVYFHLKELDVKPGQIVEKGQRIGSVGVSGLATGPHLHWEVRVNGVAVDPRELTQSEIIDKITTAGNGG